MSDAPFVTETSARGDGAKAGHDPGRADGDRELMRQFMSGGDQGFSIFYRQFAPGLLSIAYRIVQDQKEAEDALQDAFVQMWKNTSTYDSTRSSLFTWAVMITRNKAIDRIRSRQRRHRTIENFTEEMAAAATAESGEQADTAVTQREERGRIRAALSRLPEAQREVIDLAFFGGMTQAEVAAKLNTPLGTVKARIRRGLIALRDALHST